MLGNISKTLEPSPIHANHTLLDKDTPTLATQHVTTVNHSLHTNAPKALLLKPPHHQKSNLKSSKTDQWKLDSQFTKTSSNTVVVSINTPQVEWPVDTPSKSLVGVQKTELTTGSVLTLGDLNGEKVVSSESLGDNATLTPLSMPAHQQSELLYSNLKITEY